MKPLLFAGIMAAFVLLFISVDYGDSVLHERIHERIYAENGCIESETNIRIFGDSTFECLSFDEDVFEYSYDFFALNTMNDIVNYNLSSLKVVIIISTIFVLAFLNILINEVRCTRK